jgi:hypothetical protein
MNNFEIIKLFSENNKQLYCVNGYQFTFKKFFKQFRRIAFSDNQFRRDKN